VQIKRREKRIRHRSNHRRREERLLLKMKAIQDNLGSLMIRSLNIPPVPRVSDLVEVTSIYECKG
jgi:hypothetical protein